MRHGFSAIVTDLVPSWSVNIAFDFELGGQYKSVSIVIMTETRLLLLFSRAGALPPRDANKARVAETMRVEIIR